MYVMTCISEDGLELLRYTLVEILYFGDMLLWNQMKLKMTPIVFGMLSSKAKVMASCRGTLTTSINSPSWGFPPPSPTQISSDTSA